MLSLKRIMKEYRAGDSCVRALDGVSLDFRKSEFVSVLGPSGCGKTTLLNIIGGLDQYTSGDLVINGVSTKKYTDADWDTYRNHSIGFVFQSYNLIPHQTVLANVELALTLSGVSKRVRKARAIEALRMVGLENQLHKKPNQMSGGQMQRVAIARALVNDPDILLADEPTGALDTQTSVQIMDILRSISRTRLIIMVTHNPELATRYSSRIIKLLDGRVVSDSKPFVCPPIQNTVNGERKSAKKRFGNPFAVRQSDLENAQIGGILHKKEEKKPTGKRSMSFFTALSLSLNNLMTKKARTFMTSFAGSIGIIGIALILSVSTGVNNFINSVQRDTLASYPITLEAESVDLSSLVTSLMGAGDPDKKPSHELDKVYENAVIADLMNALNSAESNINDLKSFKTYMESTEEFKKYLTAVQYGYNFDWSVFTKATDGTVTKADVTELLESFSGNNGYYSGSSPMTSMSKGYNVWQELLKGNNGEPINDLIKEEYDLIHGSWPQNYNEILLVVDEKNEISDLVLYALGLRTKQEITDAMLAATKGEILDTSELGSWTYEEICNMRFRLLLASECYQKQDNGTYADLTKTEAGREYLYRNTTNGVELKVVGIIRPNEEATSSVLTGSIAYTSALTDYAIDKTASSQLLLEQMENPTVDILTGLPFKTDDRTEPTDEQKKQAVIDYIATLSNAEKAALYTAIASVPSEDEVNTFVGQQLSQLSADEIRSMLINAYSQSVGVSEEQVSSYIDGMSEEERNKAAATVLAAMYVKQYEQTVTAQLGSLSVDQLCALLDAKQFTDAEYVNIYDNQMPRTVSESTYEENLKLLGQVNKDVPDTIKLYAATFEDKDAIASLIEDYNKTVSEEQKINYTDYVALLMSSITTIVNAISYVLIAFVAISLVVSSIMIGIITYISVLERTKEIGILRSIGASKKDIRRVFNAETLIIGLVAGLIGILVSLLLIVVINIILFRFTQLAGLKAALPIGAAVILVAISMFLTWIAGLFPAGVAAKRNPVEALRTE